MVWKSFAKRGCKFFSKIKNAVEWHFENRRLVLFIQNSYFFKMSLYFKRLQKYVSGGKLMKKIKWKALLKAVFHQFFSSVIQSKVIINLVLKALIVHSLLSLFQLIVTVSRLNFAEASGYWWLCFFPFIFWNREMFHNTAHTV